MKGPAGRAVALSNGVIAAVLVAALAGVALVVNPPAPPGISEFAPKATKPISKAPAGQGSSGGQGPGACAGTASCPPSGGPSASPGSAGVPTPKRSGVAGTRQCYTWPDGSVTQTFDPQSPPCIAIWDSAGGNGGRTATGVTGAEIRVVVPSIGGTITAVQRATVDFFNTSFMLYDRRIRLVPLDVSEVYAGPQGEPTPSGMRAAARKVIALKPFATVADVVDSAVFVDEVTSARVMAVTSSVNETTSELQARRAPYLWGYQQGLDVVQRNLASLACSALVGRKARHGGVDVSDMIRRFAVVLDDDDTFDTSPLTDGLAGCGSPAKVVRINPTVPGDPATTQAFLQLKTDDYTSLITYATGWSTIQAPFATNAGYTPEWVLVGFGEQEAEGTFDDQQHQLANAFGLGTWNKRVNWADEPWFRAASAMGHQPTSLEASPSFYHSLLVLASGIQMAGPRLRPQSFAAGLQSTTFANPGAGAAPAWQAGVGFGEGFSMVRDIALVWWNQTARDYAGSPNGKPGGAQGGGWCYLGNGRRFTEGTWPKSDPEMPKSGPC